MIVCVFSFTEGATAGLIIAAVGVALQMARPLADGGLPGQQARWEANVSRAAAEEEARIAEVEERMAEDAMEHGDLADTDSSGYDDYSDDDAEVGQSAVRQGSAARKRRVAPDERYA